MSKFLFLWKKIAKVLILLLIFIIYFARILWLDIIVWREDQHFGFLGLIMLVLQLRCVWTFEVILYFSGDTSKNIQFRLYDHDYQFSFIDSVWCECQYVAFWLWLYKLFWSLDFHYGSQLFFENFCWCWFPLCFQLLQLVVERMLASEGIKRVELSRDEFTERVWEWKEK